ncbi:MAG TPA: glycosyltransferase family 4 protein, partial [Chloroflexota bacterium]|nr:glycosyltransferase family 4 protein [Chloroflexota bacterium]
TSQRIAALLRRYGREAEAVAEEARGAQSAVREEHIASTFDRVYVCSSADRQRLLDRHTGTEICVLPNAIRLPAARTERPGDAFTLLFVGTLGYYPNVEALRFFCTSVLPAVRRGSQRRVRVLVVGRGATPEVQALCRRSGVDLAGAVPDIDPYYREADVAVAPVHAGGGTRIKILEAFGYGVPIVSTSIGAEGIDARHEEHLLIADRPDDFASACLRLACDADLARRLSENALTLVRNAYSLDAMRETIDGLYSSPPHPESR